MSVTLHTNYGDIKIEIFCESVPKTAENFLALCASSYYDNSQFHRLIPNFMVQTGAPPSMPKGGVSIWGELFEDEIRPTLRHNARGIVSMANKGPATNGSQFFICFQKAQHLDGKNTVFGHVLGDESFDTLAKIEEIEVDKKHRPKQEIKINFQEDDPTNNCEISPSRCQATINIVSMAAIIRSLFRGPQASPSPVPVGDADFAEFAGAVPVEAKSFLPIDTASTSIPYTKWYNIHERHSPSEFVQEAIILSFLIVIIAIHLIGTGINRKKVKNLIAALGPSLHKEFGLLGFGINPSENSNKWNEEDVEDIIREKSPSEFASYATGRQNIAFIDINVTLLKRFSPLSLFVEAAMSVFFESIATPTEQLEAIIYPFDGKETLLVPKTSSATGESRKHLKSTFDGFVWAIVNKDNLKNLRDDRYDLSLTSTKDSSKLPSWVTIMSESPEITEMLLTPELISTVEQSHEMLNYLIITDQPIDQPVKLEDTVPKKRIYLGLKIPTPAEYNLILPIFEYFLRLTDSLVQIAHFRPEVSRKVKGTREDAIRKILKSQEEQKVEERNLEREKAKRLKRDLELKALDSKAQKKYLEKEKEKEMRKSQKKHIQKR
ncbi:UPF0674 endoplasmic reticulum membrane protein [Erysiphe neolycopersici]|uniref:UPF0674 endoplasmic reticulum membrane protein n=1 Tax=Erysiphe neolycopersici TaxID=212602 RepID=A0A420I250_9PEZI|nr:UPF0674 endoplasmic reticulum membrane protein [Erysiphe neolycopersici]